MKKNKNWCRSWCFYFKELLLKTNKKNKKTLYKQNVYVSFCKPFWSVETVSATCNASSSSPLHVITLTSAGYQLFAVLLEQQVISTKRFSSKAISMRSSPRKASSSSSASASSSASSSASASACCGFIFVGAALFWLRQQHLQPHLSGGPTPWSGLLIGDAHTQINSQTTHTHTKRQSSVLSVFSCH